MRKDCDYVKKRRKTLRLDAENNKKERTLKQKGSEDYYCSLNSSRNNSSSANSLE